MVRATRQSPAISQILLQHREWSLPLRFYHHPYRDSYTDRFSINDQADLDLDVTDLCYCDMLQSDFVRQQSHIEGIIGNNKKKYVHTIFFPVLSS